MHPEDRLGLFIFAAFVVAIPVYVFNLPAILIDIVIELRTSFVVSGIFYLMLVEIGLDFLEDMQVIGFVSAMTIAVFLAKNLLI